ncbi:MAG TPA: RluA family pseudouridine synthase [Chthoniobacteraceae bacterium]|nr:RluA family pseudouridine synthase [Chthoniobacteraceae bacterium]
MTKPEASEFRITPEQAGARLDHYLAAELAHLSRARIQALIKSGDILLNGSPTKPGAKIKPGDSVSVHEPPPVPLETAAEEIPLDILHEDDDLIVVNKPAGMVVHPAAGNWSHTLVNALLHHCKGLSGIGGAQRPGIVHRLDKDTSGCIVMAKNDAAHQSLTGQFAGRKVLKIYLALAAGHFQKTSGIIENSIGRHPVHRKKMAVVEGRGRNAKTAYRVIQQLADASLVECTLHTGRTHQIRVHLKHLGHPLLGDQLYAGAKAGAYPRQMLHAWKLGFFHPRNSRWMEFQSPLPRDFLDAGIHIKA